MHLAVQPRLVFYSCALQFYPDQLHLVVLPQPVLVLGDSTPTNCTCRSYPNLFLFSVPCGSTPTNCTWRFYPYRFFILAPSSSIQPSVYLAGLPWPVFLKPSQAVLSWPAWLSALRLAVLPWPTLFIAWFFNFFRRFHYFKLLYLLYTILYFSTIADHTESELTQGSSTSSAHHNIPLLQGIENHSKWATHMQFYLGGIQATHLIEKDPPQL